MMDSLVYLPLANNVPDSEVDRWGLFFRQASQDRLELILLVDYSPCLREPAGNSVPCR